MMLLKFLNENGKLKYKNIDASYASKAHVLHASEPQQNKLKLVLALPESKRTQAEQQEMVPAKISLC